MKDGKVCVAVDFDGTLVTYDGFKGIDKFGEFVPDIVNLVEELIEQDVEISIFTARICEGGDEGALASHYIAEKLSEIGLGHLEITCVKHFKFDAFIDDRAIAIAKNKGSVLLHDCFQKHMKKLIEDAQNEH